MMTTAMTTRDPRRWPLMRGLGMLLAMALLATPTAAQKDEEPEAMPATQPAPPTVREMAEQMATLENEMDRIKTDIADMQKGRLAEIAKEMVIQSRILSQTRTTAGGGSKFTAKQRKEYNRLRREYARKLSDLKKERSEQLKKYKSSRSGQKYKDFRKKVEQTYKKARDDAKSRHKQDLKDLKKDGGDDEDPKAKRKEAAEQLKTLRQERIELNKKIADLRRGLPKKETVLRTLRDKVAAHPEEAWEAGLRPRFGSYYVDEKTDRLAVRGGTWGHPRDNDLWKRSNASQAEVLLALATRATSQGKAALAHTCLQRILDEFAALPQAAKARTLMEQLDKPAGK